MPMIVAAGIVTTTAAFGMSCGAANVKGSRDSKTKKSFMVQIRIVGDGKLVQTFVYLKKLLQDIVFVQVAMFELK